VKKFRKPSSLTAKRGENMRGVYPLSKTLSPSPLKERGIKGVR
jgi:hypothetical protein